MSRDAANPAGQLNEQPLRVEGLRGEEDPLEGVPENELRSLAPSEGTGLTGNVEEGLKPPPESQDQQSQPPPTSL